MKYRFMKLIILSLLLCLLQMQLPAGASREIYSEDFEDIDGGDLAYFWLFDDGNAVGAIGSDGGFEMKDGYLRAKWLNGRTFRYIENVSDYTLEFDWRTGGNANPQKSCYKGALALRLPDDYSYSYRELAICEPDNTDNDPTSYLGALGIYLYAYESKLDVGIHTIDETRDLGVTSKIYSFSLPEGQSFDSFTRVKIMDTEQEISIYVADTLLGTVRLSALEKDFKAKQYSGPSYTTVKVFNAEDQEVLSVENAVVPPKGSFAFTNRACWYELDNLVLLDNSPAASATVSPTADVSPTPDTTPDTAATPANAPGTVDRASGISDTGITVILVVCLAIIAGVVIFIIYKMKKTDTHDA